METYSESSNSVAFETVEGILSIADKQELEKFLCKYAGNHPEFKKALLQRLTPARSTASHPVGYYKKIEKCFNSSIKSSRPYGKYSTCEDVDLYKIGEKLGQYLKKAEYLLAQKSFGDAAAIAVQILRSIAEHYEEDEYESEAFDDRFNLSAECKVAGDLLMQLAENDEVSPSLKETVFDDLCDMTDLEAYCEYRIYEMNELAKNFKLGSSTKEGSLKLLDEMLSEGDDSLYLTRDLVNRKIDLLNELNRGQEVEKVIEEYIAEPEIRKIKINNLLDKQDYKAAIQCIDEGISLAREMSLWMTVSGWLKNKLEIYQQLDDMPQVLFVAQELLKNNKRSLDYSYLQNKYVPKQYKKLFLENLMQDEALSSPAFLVSSAAADIYVAEKDKKRLFDLLKATSPSEQLGMLLQYAHHLKHNYSAELLDIYTERLKEYAEQNIGRNYYEYVAVALTAMKGLYHGRKAVDELVTLFRTLYKQRPEMMELIRKF